MKDKLLAVFNRVKDGVINLFNRFPIASNYIILQYISLSLVMEWDYFDVHPKQLYVIVLVALSTYALIFQSIIIQFLTERFNWSVKKNLLLNLGSILVTSSFFIIFMYKDIMAFDTLAGNFTGNLYRLIIFVGLSIISTLIIPFVKDTNNKVWWNFTMYSANKAAVSFLYSFVLYIGILIALGALESFWKITLFDHQFELLPILTFILFAPLNFLSDVYDFKFQGTFETPKFLTIFGKFILTPLIVIYMCILYPYMFSFPFKTEWPTNQSTFIILAMIAMIYAVMYIFWNTDEKEPNYKFINNFTRVANAITVPTVLFWAYSMWLRIDAYKLTVNRFVVMVLILWFLSNSIYFVIAKKKDIRVILTSFIAVLVISFYFPFSAYYFGQRAQEKRLVDIAQSQDILKDDVIIVGEKEKAENSERDMKDTVIYLNVYHSLNGVKSKLSEPILAKLKIDNYGYSKQYLNNYSSYDYLFFGELIKTSTIDGDNNYIGVVLENNDIMIPQGYTKIDSLESYDYGKFVYDGTRVVYQGESYDINVDLASDKFTTRSSSPFEKENYYGNNTYFTTDQSVMTFESTDSILIVTNLNAILKNGKISELQGIVGFILKK